MTRYPKHKKASRGKAPEQKLYVNPDALDIPFLEVRDIRKKKKTIAGAEKACTFYYGEYDPPMSLLRAQFGPTCQTDGWEERCFPYDTRNHHPRFLVVWCRRVRFVVDGKPHYGLARPAGFNNGRPYHDDLDRAVFDMLAESSVAQIRRATGLSRPRIKHLCSEIVETYLEELAKSSCAPLFLAIDGVDPTGRKGQKDKKRCGPSYLMVTGSDPRRGESFYLGLFKLPPGNTKWSPQLPIVRDLKALLLALPVPQDLLGVAVDGEGRLRNLMQAALDSAARQNPVFKQVRFGLDPWHVILNCAKSLAAQRNKLRREEGAEDEAFAKALWYANDLEQKHWALIPKARQKELKRLMGRAQELRDLHGFLMAVRHLLRLPTRAAAVEAWEALCAGLTAPQRARLRNFLDYMAEHREEFLTYFDMKEKTRLFYEEGYSMSSGLAEAMNGQVKQRWTGGANVSLEIVRAQMISAFGYPTAASLAALKDEEQSLRALSGAGRAAATAVDAIATPSERQEHELWALRGVEDADKPDTLLADCVVSLRELPVVARHGAQLR